MFFFVWTRISQTSSRIFAHTSPETDIMGGPNLKLFLLILLPGLSCSTTAEVRMLDMAPNAVDATFSKCHDNMLQAVTNGLLQQELEAREDFKHMWRNPGGTCEKQIFGATPYHLAALQAYGNSGVKFRKLFNDMVQTKGSNNKTYNNEFPFKSLHFLLTDALKILNHGKRCYTVYYGTGNKYTVETGKEVRFGRFIHPRIQESLEIEATGLEGEGTLFNITSCSVVNVENYTCTSEEIEQLISPYEVFTVQSTEHISNDDSEYKLITLTHSGFLSYHDCYYLSRSLAALQTYRTLVLIVSLIFVILLPASLF